MSDNKSYPLQYIPEFDSLRAIAAIFVIINHTEGVFGNSSFHFGATGVGFFFVLSGFLITRILVYEKYTLQFSNKKLLGRFYFKRFIRIFPAYYLFLLINYLLGNLKDDYTVWYYIAYASNFLFFKTANFQGSLSPTWTLAVEEQFYLLWPLLFTIISRKWFMRVVFMILTGSVVFRVAFVFWCKNKSIDASLEGVLLHSNLHFLMVGALLAYLSYNGHKILKRLANTYILLSSAFLLICLSFMAKNFFWLLIFKLYLSLFSFLLINYVFQNTLLQKIRFLQNSFLQFIGRISYGVYLYHTIGLSLITLFIIKVFGVDFNLLFNFSNSYVVFLLTLISSIIVAAISWILFEKPILKLKSLAF